MRIPGYSAYDITEDGVVTEIATGKEIEKHEGSYRYIWVSVIEDGYTVKRQTNLHVLMALAFLGPRPEGRVVRFLDNNPRNVHPSNLRWATRTEVRNNAPNVDANGSIVVSRIPKQNKSCSPETTRLVYDTLQILDRPITMLDLANMLQVPYAHVRYSMYALMAMGKVGAVRGGYVTT